MARAQPSQDDRSILDATNDLCQTLDVDFHPTRVSWIGMVADECGFIRDRVLVPRVLRGLVSGEDLKPLLASSIIYLRKYRSIRSRNLLGVVIIPWSFPLIVMILAALAFGRDPTLWARIGTLVEFGLGLIFVLIAFSSIARFSGRSRRLRLKADREASALVGREALVRILSHIDSLGLKCIEEEKRHGGIYQRFVSSRPTITQRVNNLTNGRQNSSTQLGIAI